MRNLFLAILLTTIPSSEQADAISYLMWGKYCGECVGKCSTIYKITQNSFEIDTSNNFLDSLNSGAVSYQFFSTQASENSNEKYNWVFNTHWPKLTKSQLTIGLPDAYDQCGIFLSYEIGGITYKVLIDPDKTDHEFQPLLTKLLKDI